MKCTWTFLPTTTLGKFSIQMELSCSASTSGGLTSIPVLHRPDATHGHLRPKNEVVADNPLCLDTLLPSPRTRRTVLCPRGRSGQTRHPQWCVI